MTARHSSNACGQGKGGVKGEGRRERGERGGGWVHAALSSMAAAAHIRGVLVFWGHCQPGNDCLTVSTPNKVGGGVCMCVVLSAVVGAFVPADQDLFGCRAHQPEHQTPLSSLA